MKTEFTASQIQQYREQGFLVVEGFLDEAELAHWRRMTDEAVQQRLAARPAPQGDEYYRRVFTQCIRLADEHAGIADLVLKRQLGAVLGALAGVKGIRVWHDQALYKPPYGNPTGWHLDCPYWSFESRDAISIWVALDDATLGNGCLWYLPGTHKLARYEQIDLRRNIDDLFRFYPEWLSIEPVAAPVRAGGAIFHNGLVAHAAGANMTNNPRRAMTCAYMPDGATFAGKKSILPEELFTRLKIGDVLNDSAVNPLVWSRD
jgi:phytanoyl-CoA hydroxylase